MKKFISLSTIFALLFLFISCNNEAIDETTSNLELNSSKENNIKKTTGYDAWGFNFQAHHFKSYLINALLGDPAYEGMDHYRKLVYQGEGEQFWEDLVDESAYPYFKQMMPSGLLDCKMEMTWNDALCNSEGIYPPTWNDTGAWIMFKYKMNTLDERWSQLRKLVSISAGDYLEGGIWYNSEGQEIGLQSYYWPDQLIIKQVVNTGYNQYVPWAMPDDYICPNWVGFGNI